MGKLNEIDTYSEAAAKHFMSPKNTEAINGVNGIGCATSGHLEDLIELALRVDDDEVIGGVRCRSFGCASAIASGSVFSEMLSGRSLSQAAEITAEQVISALEGLPRRRACYARLPILALGAAIVNYREREMASSNPHDRSFAHRRAPKNGEVTL